MQVPDAVVELLTDQFGPLTPAGAGAWSTAFKFFDGDSPFVVRVGTQVVDFEMDAEMAAYSSDTLPIPLVALIDRLAAPHDDLFLCVSTFVSGEPLEEVPEAAWSGLVPAVADVLDAMRLISPPPNRPASGWPDTLLAESSDDGRLSGWKANLDARPEQLRTYREAMRGLEELCQLPQCRVCLADALALRSDQPECPC